MLASIFHQSRNSFHPQRFMLSLAICISITFPDCVKIVSSYVILDLEGQLFIDFEHEYHIYVHISRIR